MPAVLALVLTLLFPRSGQAQGSDPSPEAVVRSFVEAFNRHDVPGMVAMVTEDVELFYADDEGVFEVASGTSAQLANDMERYFADRPDVRSRIAALIPGPVFVSFREQIVGGQSSVAIYEVRGGLIRRAWYFPAEDTRSNGGGS